MRSMPSPRSGAVISARGRSEGFTGDMMAYCDARVMFGDGTVTVTAGIDIGTTSVKAVACDDEGRVVARTRVPHRVVVPRPDRLEHDANQAWRRGPRRALAALVPAGIEAVAV